MLSDCFLKFASAVLALEATVKSFWWISLSSPLRSQLKTPGSSLFIISFAKFISLSFSDIFTSNGIIMYRLK